jgi:hypothetical protein
MGHTGRQLSNRLYLLRLMGLFFQNPAIPYIPYRRHPRLTFLLPCAHFTLFIMVYSIGDIILDRGSR